MRSNGAAILVGVLALAVGAHADTIYNGTIYWLDGPGQVGDPFGWELTTTTVDHIPFTVHTEGIITMDVMSYEVDWGAGYAIDLNGDGEIAYIDSYIHLFHDDGDLTADDHIVENDDFWPPDLYDESVDSQDSFLQYILPIGDYLLAIGCYDLSVEDAVSGINDEGYSPVTAAEDVQYPDEYIHDHGDYQLTFIGDLTVTPEPATLGLLVLAALFRRPR